MKLDGINNTGTRAIQLGKSNGNSYDPATRSIPCTFATETPILLTKDGEMFYEVLSCNPAHVRLRRLQEGAPVLDDHNKYGSRSVLGTTRDPKISGNRIDVTLRFSKRKDVEDIVQDVQDDILNNISCGYRVFHYTDISAANAKYPTYLADDWEPFEVSLVPVPFDENGKTRSMPVDEAPDALAEVTKEAPEPEINTETAPVEVVTTEEENETLIMKLGEDQNKPDVDATQVTNIERTRALEINTQAAAAGLGSEFAATHIEKGTSIEGFRGLVITELLAKKAEGVELQTRGIITATSTKVTSDEIEKVKKGVEIGLSRKLGISIAGLDSADLVESEQYRSMSVLDIARSYMHKAGIEGMATMGGEALSIRALSSTSSADFPVLLEGTARRKLLAGYAIIPDKWAQIAVKGSVTDFREYKRLRSGSLGNLKEVAENGEYENMDIPDGSYESIIISTYGKTINLTRKMLINDDLGAFMDLVDKLGRGAKRTIEEKFWQLFALNANRGPLMSDGLSLFHANHSNLMTSGALSSATLKTMKLAMAGQKDKEGNDYLDMSLHTMILSTALEDDANLLNDSKFTFDPNIFEKPNISKGLFKQIIATPRIVSPTAWYGMADKDVNPTFEVAFLNGQENPYLEQQKMFDTDGIRWKVRHDFGMGAIDFRTIMMNAGV